MSNQNGNSSGGAELSRVMGLRSLIFYGVAFVIPLAFFTTYGIVTNTTHGHVSMTYVGSYAVHGIYCLQLLQNGKSIS